jgi:hypothetical protein
MIRRLRRRHRRIWLALAVALPILYWMALAARPEAPVIDRLPMPLAASAADGALAGPAR